MGKPLQQRRNDGLEHDAAVLRPPQADSPADMAAKYDTRRPDEPTHDRNSSIENRKPFEDVHTPNIKPVSRAEKRNAHVE